MFYQIQIIFLSLLRKIKNIFFYHLDRFGLVFFSVSHNMHYFQKLIDCGHSVHFLCIFIIYDIICPKLPKQIYMQKKMFGYYDNILQICN